MRHGLGWRRDIEKHIWLMVHQTRFANSSFMSLSIPDRVDPRAYRSIRDQGELGSCSGASRTAIEEGLNQFANKSKEKILLSMMYAYLTNQKECDCFGADNGATIAGSVQAAGKEGICREELFPYTGKYTTEIPEAAAGEGTKHLIQSHSAITTFDQAIQYLATAGIIQIGIPVGNAFQSCIGPLTLQRVRRDFQRPEGGHALAVIGYVPGADISQASTGADQRPWLIGQNSWGIDWGAGGFFFVAPDAWDFLCSQIPSGEVEIQGMSHLQSFDDPNAAIDWSECYA